MASGVPLVFTVNPIFMNSTFNHAVFFLTQWRRREKILSGEDDEKREKYEMGVSIFTNTRWKNPKVDHVW